LHVAQEHARELEKKLAASEKARRDPEAKTASAELALSDKDEQIAQREAAIIARLNTQSTRFSSTIVLILFCIFCFVFSSYLY
jgi:hypothetical protein